MTFPTIDLFSTRPCIALGSIQISDDQLKNYIKTLQKKLLSFMLQDIAYITFYFVQNENYLNKIKKYIIFLHLPFQGKIIWAPRKKEKMCWNAGGKEITKRL